MRGLLILIIALYGMLGTASAKYVRIGVLSLSELTSVLVKASAGNYEMYADNKKVMELEVNTLVTVNLKNNLLVVSIAGNEIGQFSSVRLSARTAESTIRIKPLTPALKEGLYDDSFEIKAGRDRIRLVNIADIDNYVAGVLESEIGMNKNPEFLKVQAIICRTYAVSNYGRHRDEGFDLCDMVHCQAYKGKSRLNLLISLAVSATSGKILMDRNGKPIISAFHSNCGGETYNSEDIWPSQVSYLRSVRDSFCTRAPHSVWQQRIPVKDWVKYLSAFDKIGRLKKDTTFRDFNFEPEKKEPFYIYKGVIVPVKDIRKDWKFRSSYFSIKQQNDTLCFEGRGYGHGIGMCQEGAMSMAALGYKHMEIINFYYRDVIVTSITTPGSLKE